MMLSTPSNPAQLSRFAKPEPGQGRTGIGLALLIFGGAAALHIYSVAFLKIDMTSAPLVLILFAMLCWLSVGMFIVAHDAMHGSLIPGWPRLSSFIGGLMLFVYAGFGWRKMRDAHMDHHKYSGTARDPDFDAAHPTAFWPWYFTFLKRYFGIVPIIYVFAVTWSYILLFGFDPVNVVLLYGAPAIISSFQLFYFGTYRPHRHEAGNAFPDHHNARTAPYGHLTSLFTCFHFGYHEEHHIAPYVPWWGLPERRRARLDGVGKRGDALAYEVR